MKLKGDGASGVHPVAALNDVEFSNAVPVSWCRWTIAMFRDYALFGYFTPYMRRARELGAEAVLPERLPPLKKRDDINYWSTKFAAAAQREWTRPKGPSSVALFRVMWRVFWKYIIAIFLLKVLKIGLDVASSRFLKGFLKWQEQQPGTASSAVRTKGVLHGLAVVFLQLACVFLFSQFQFWIERIMMRIEGSLATCLFRRTLMSKIPSADELSGKDPEAKTVREAASTYNILMIDVPSIARSTCILIDLAVLPVGLIWCYMELRNNVGDSAEIGLYVICVVVGIMFLLELYNGYLKKPLLRWRDLRLHHLHDVMSNIRSIRVAGWEGYAASEISEARAKEIDVRRVRMYAHGVSWALSDCTRFIIQLAIFTCYVVRGLRTDSNFVFQASVVMPSLQLVMRLLGPLTDCSFLLHSLLEGAVSSFRYQAHVFGFTGSAKPSALPSGGRQRLYGDARGSVDDVDDLGSLKDGDDQQKEPLLCAANSSAAPTVQPALSPSGGSNPQQCITVRQAVFSWSADPGPLGSDFDAFRVVIPQLEVRRGQCVILLGHPGSGKSSVIMSLLGEMQRLKGESRLRRSWRPVVNEDGQVVYPITHAEKALSAPAVGYASQTPWLPDGTVHSAILMGRPYDPKRYRRVIEACELALDFASWPDADQRVIVQGGLSLSAGQRQRVALARALYDFPVPSDSVHHLSHSYIDKTGHQGCATFLLDDVFSSLDPTVGSLVFQHLVGGGAGNGLLQHAGTLLTMDEQNLFFFLKTLSQSSATSSVEFLVKIVDRGVVSDFPVALLNTLQLGALQRAPRATPAPTPQDCAEDDAAEQSCVLGGAVPGASSCVSGETPSTSAAADAGREPQHKPEGVHVGSIGLKVYFWYWRQSGLKLMALIFFMVIVLSTKKLGSELWLAHWAGMHKAPSPLLPPATVVANTNGTSFIHQSQGLSVRNRDREADHPFHPPHFFLSRHANEAASLAAGRKRRNRYLDTTESNGKDGKNAGGYAYYPVEDAPEAFPAPATSASFLQADNVHRGAEPSFPPQQYVPWFLQPVRTTTALAVFIWLSVGVIVGAMVLTLSTTLAALKAAVTIHNKLLMGIINAPFWIYDAIPLGVIINRFSSDVQAVDTSPLFSINRLLMSISHLFLIILVLCLIRPTCCGLALIVGWFVYTFVYKLYRPSCREFQRSTLLSWSPLCSNLSEAESGTVVIRALGAQTYYVNRNVFLTSEMMKTQFMHNGVLRWGTTRLQLLASSFAVINNVIPIMLTLVGLETFKMGVLSKLFSGKQFIQTAGFVGLGATYAMEMPRYVGDLVLNVAYLDKAMCSIQRIQTLVGLTSRAQESASKTWKCVTEAVTKVDDMPQKRSGLTIDDVEVSYRLPCSEASAFESLDDQGNDVAGGAPAVHFPPSISGFAAVVKPGDHIGIIGRTGAGKSTILLSLLDLAPITKGSICIDGVPLTRIAPEVREKIIGVLPQVPLVMKGWTVRRFLDPKHEYDGATLMRAIANVRMTRVIASLPNGLETVIIKDELDAPADQDCYDAADPAACLSVTVGSQLDAQATSTHWLTETQLRTLSIARLSLGADHYRLVLMDEPPTKQLGSLHGLTSSAANRENVDDPDDAEDVEIGTLLKEIFPTTTVIIAAHYASTIQHCDAVWLISRGRCVATVPGSQIGSQEDLMRLIKDAESSVY